MATPFPNGGRAIVEQMAAKFPELFVNDDELQRQLTIKIGQQFAFTYGPNWGGKKRAGVPDALRSKDSIAVKEADGTTSVWDMFSSSLDILVNDGDLPKPGTHANLPPSEATFMADAPFDYLGTGSQPHPPDSSDVEARIAALEAQVSALQSQVGALQSQVGQLEQHALKDTDTLEATGRTGTTWGHSHGVSLTVRKQ